MFQVNTVPANAKPTKTISKFGQKQLGGSDYNSEDYDNYFDEVFILPFY